MTVAFRPIMSALCRRVEIPPIPPLSAGPPRWLHTELGELKERFHWGWVAVHRTSTAFGPFGRGEPMNE